MENEKLLKYVNEKRITGLSDKQIATSLGMSLKHLKSLLGEKLPASQPVKEDPPVARVGMSFVGGDMNVVPVSGVISFSEPKDTKLPETKPPKPEDTNPAKPGKKEKAKESKHGWVESET